MPRIVTTPIAPLLLPERRVTARAIASEVIAAALPGPGRDSLAAGDVLTVTTGQQPGLFTGPLYTIYKALSAIALARRLEAAWRVSVVPFLGGGRRHNVAEAKTGRSRHQGEWQKSAARGPAEAPQLPLARERCGEEIHQALAQLRPGTPETEVKGTVLGWLEAAYRPDVSLADAFADALQRLFGDRGLVVLRAHDKSAKRAAASHVLQGLSVTLPDDYTPVLVDARLGRDRLRVEGNEFATRRSAERFTRAALEQIARDEPERLSPNVLLRPVVEGALLRSAYVGGPAELEYLPAAAPLYEVVDGGKVQRQAPVPRWSGTIVESRVDKLLERHSLRLEDLEAPPGVLEARVMRESLPPDVMTRFGELRQALEER